MDRSQSRLPPPPQLLAAVAVAGLAWYLTWILGWLNGDVVDYQRYLDRFLALGSLPIEYPPIDLLIFGLTALPHAAWPIPYFAAWMAIPFLGGYLATWWVKGPRAAFAYLALLSLGSIALVVTRFDLVPSLLTLAALWTAQRRRWSWAYALLALGGLSKLYPLALLPVFALVHLRQEESAGRTLRAALPGLLLLAAGLLVPLAWLGPRSLDFLRGLLLYRPAELESTPAALAWALGGGHTDFAYGQVGFSGPWIRVTVVAGDLLLLAVYAAVLWRTARGRLALGPAAILTVAAVLAFSKVLSAQYLIWLLPLVASEEGLTPSWVGVAALTTLAYPVLWLGAPQAAAPLMLALLARDLLLAGIVFGRAGAGEALAVAGRLLGRWRRLPPVIAAVVFLEVIAAEAAYLVATAAGPLHSPDFLAYFTAGRIVLAGHGSRLYDIAEQTAAQAAITAGWGGDRFLLAWVEPPTAALLVTPFAALPYRWAYVWWLTVQLLALLAAILFLLRAERLRGWRAALAAAGALATLPAFVVLLQGQLDSLCLLGLAILRADWERPSWRSAVGVFLLLLKPHLAGVVILLLLARRATALALAAGGAVSLVLAVAFLGPWTWFDWLRLILPTAAGVAEGWVTGHVDKLALSGQLEALGLSTTAAIAVCGLLGVALFALLLTRRPPPAAALAVAAAGSVLVSPHVNAHDQVLLLMPGLVVAAGLLAAPDRLTTAALALAVIAVDAALFVNAGVVVAGVAILLFATLRVWWASAPPEGEPGAAPRRRRSPPPDRESAPPRPAPPVGSAG